MGHSFTLVLAGARVVDPASGIDGCYNIGISEGRIAEVSSGSLNARAEQILDLQGMTVLPGIIDLHTHISRAFGSSYGGCHMLARAGVCTTLEMAGPAPDVYRIMASYGSGINVAVLEGIVPGKNLAGADAGNEEIGAFVARALKEGALGVKILGGHYPLTPDANHRVVTRARGQGAYVAWHCGSTATDNTIVAVREFFEICRGQRVHLAHVNSYCRGLHAAPMEEVAEAIALLQAAPEIYCESYIAASNGTRLAMGPDGGCASRSTGENLISLGFENSAAGMEAAIRAGTVYVFAPKGLEIEVITGDSAADLWLECGGEIGGGMHINPAAPRLALCLAKDVDGRFVVDALSTDGGVIPRNNIVSDGLGLVNINAMSLEDFVRKTSINPAKILNLPGKGHFAPGADADITVVDLAGRRPVTTIVNGAVVMHQGFIMGRGGTIITTAQGKESAAAYGLPVVVTDISQGPLPLF